MIDRRGVLRTGLAGALACALPSGVAQAITAPTGKPNFVVYMTDDQDSRQPLEWMPLTKAKIVDRGINFTETIVPFSVCEAARATFHSGQVPHNHGILGVNPPKGGYTVWMEQEASALPVWLQQAGYRTFFAGKYMNGYGTQPDRTHVPPGWDEFHAINDPQAPYRYYGPTLCDKAMGETEGTLNKYHDAYITDVLFEKANAFIQQAVADGAPFYVLICTLAPHGGAEDPGSPTPRKDHLGLFDHRSMRKLPDFDEADMSDKPVEMSSLPRLGDAGYDRMNYIWRRRNESLLAVDEGVGMIEDALVELGVSAATLSVLFSDNGYMLGEHRWESKVKIYEESQRIPLFMRGPHIPTTGQVLTDMVNTTDIVATIVDLSKCTPDRVIDGRTLAPLFSGIKRKWRTAQLYENGATQAVKTANFVYAETNGKYGLEVELYYLGDDPYEMRSIDVTDHHEYAKVQFGLAKLLNRLRGAKGNELWTQEEFGPPPLEG